MFQETTEKNVSVSYTYFNFMVSRFMSTVQNFKVRTARSQQGRVGLKLQKYNAV